MVLDRRGKPFNAGDLGLPCFPRGDLIDQTPVGLPRRKGFCIGGKIFETYTFPDIT
jgi:hypothetical protein